MRLSDLKAKYNASGTAIIPNTFQHPNVFVDRLMALLTPEENIVLTFAVRRILGFQGNIMSRKDHISLSQFVRGLHAKDGTIISHGCGLGPNAVRRALESLLSYNILLPTTKKPDPKKGQEYWLQDNEAKIDWDGLTRRKEEKIQLGAKRTDKARCVVGQHTVVGQQPSVLWDNNTKPIETHVSSEASPRTRKATDIPEVVLFREVTSRYPNKANFEDVETAIQKVSTRLGRPAVADDLLPFFKNWTSRGWRSDNLAWLEWAVSGIIPERGNGPKGKSKVISPGLDENGARTMTEEEAAAVRAEWKQALSPIIEETTK